ncbi:hypothetical protein D3C71_1791170 [compost metagenome]
MRGEQLDLHEVAEMRLGDHRLAPEARGQGDVSACRQTTLVLGVHERLFGRTDEVLVVEGEHPSLVGAGDRADVLGRGPVEFHAQEALGGVEVEGAGETPPVREGADQHCLRSSAARLFASRRSIQEG